MLLKNIITINRNKICCDELNENIYITTENMLPDFGGHIKASNVPHGKCTKIHPNNTLLSNIRPYFKKVLYCNFYGGCSNDIIVMESSNNEVLLNKYLFYIICSNKFINLYVKNSKGTKMPRGDINVLLNYDINIPTLSSQQHIVDTIGSVDDAIEKNEEIIEKINKIFLIIFDLYESNKQSKLQSITEILSGGIFRSKDYVEKSDYKLITIKNVDENGFNSNNVDFLSENNIDKKYLLDKGDLILTMTGNVGRIGIVFDNNCYLNQRLIKIKSFSQMYIYLYLLKYKKNIISLGKGTAQKNLSLIDFQNLNINNSIEEIKLFKKYDYAYNIITNLLIQNYALKKIREQLLSKYFD